MPNLLSCSPDVISTPCNPAQTQHATDAGSDVDIVVLYNQIRSLPRMIVEPYYVLYSSRLPERANPGLYQPKSASQLRHMVGLRENSVTAIGTLYRKRPTNSAVAQMDLDSTTNATSPSTPGRQAPGSAIPGTTTHGNPGSRSDSITPRETATAIA